MPGFEHSEGEGLLLPCTLLYKSQHSDLSDATLERSYRTNQS